MLTGTSEQIQLVMERIKEVCRNDHPDQDLPNKNETLIDINDVSSFSCVEDYPQWQVEVNTEFKTAYLYFFRNNKGFAEVSVKINENNEWSLDFEGKPCDCDLGWSDAKVRTVSDVKLLIETVSNTRTCDAIRPFFKFY